MRFIILLCISLFLVGCLGPPTYKKTTWFNQFGYRDSSVTRNTATIDYTSTPGSWGNAYAGALRRARELTQSKGYKYFVITSKQQSYYEDYRGGGYFLYDPVITLKIRMTNSAVKGAIPSGL